MEGAGCRPFLHPGDPPIWPRYSTRTTNSGMPGIDPASNGDETAEQVTIPLRC